VFAIPGNINSSVSRGTNLLIREGAKLVMGIDDILEELPLLRPTPGQPPSPAPELSDDEEKVWRTLTGTPLHIDEITVKSSLTVCEVSAILLRLELRSLVTQLPGKIFSLLPC
jgi:DNA processing protein